MWQTDTGVHSGAGAGAGGIGIVPGRPFARARARARSLEARSKSNESKRLLGVGLEVLSRVGFGVVLGDPDSTDCEDWGDSIGAEVGAADFRA